MSTFRHFEDIIAWQKARSLVKSIYGLTKKEAFSKDYELKSQIRRAAVSVMSNIAEGHERSGRKEFIQYLSIAKGSAGEVTSLLYVALDQGYITDDEFNCATSLSREITVILASLMNYLQKSKHPGIKYTGRKLAT